MAVLLRIALILTSCVPLTSSSPQPISQSTPSPAPTPLPIEIIGDEPLTVTGLIVSAAAALVGAIAAIASWRAATAARSAAETGEAAARHAATAADAAQRTAEYERATFNFMVQQERERQALDVLVTWGGEYSGSHNIGGVNVLVENTSDRRITDLEVWAMKEGQRITVVQKMQDLGKGSQSFGLGGTSAWFGMLHEKNGKAVVRFTDAMGLRWERRSGEAPIGVDTDAPIPS